MSGELVLTLMVALLVFGPKKLPMLASHLGLFIRQMNLWKNKVMVLWEQQVQELQLQENQRKAEEADKHYKVLDNEKS